MDTFEIVVIALLVALAAFQVWLSVQVARSEVYDKAQKAGQIQLVWLLPILGAGIVFYMLHGDGGAGRSAQSRKNDAVPLESRTRVD